MRMTKFFFLAILVAFCVGTAAQSAERGSPNPPSNSPAGSQLEVPRNCVHTVQPDNSDLVTCDCDSCGRPTDSEALRTDPGGHVPWSCVEYDGGIHCGFYPEPQVHQPPLGRSQI